jgi:hypothetical protein
LEDVEHGVMRQVFKQAVLDDTLLSFERKDRYEITGG